VASHWVDAHREGKVSVDELESRLVVDPTLFHEAFLECFDAIAAEESSRVFTERPRYQIRHVMSLPRVRSTPGEVVIYVQRESVRLPRDEVEELLAWEGLDLDDGQLGDAFQTAVIELRFCNIIDGYIPLVKDVRRILPAMGDGETVRVFWQDETEAFDCTVSKRERAIYNVEGKLKDCFRPLESGVRLYIDRVGPKQYRLRLKRNPHSVPRCKDFVRDATGSLRVRVFEANVEWECGDSVFRHQMTFDQLEELHEEARRTNLSIRDAVHRCMKRIAQSESVHVRDVYEEVFLQLRTCSVAAVWAQFRPEHECYERTGRGFYRYNSSKSFPMVRTAPASHTPTPDPRPNAPVPREPRTRLKVLVHWAQIVPNRTDKKDEVFSALHAGATMARFLGALIEQLGDATAQRLTRIPVSRTHPLSTTPKRDFAYGSAGKAYPSYPVPKTNLFLCTQSSTQEKCEDIHRLVSELRLPPKSVEVSIVKKLDREAWLIDED
jgi:hypothetical protein